MYNPVFLLSIGIFMVSLCLGADYNPLFKKYPPIQKFLLAIAGICMLLSIIQIR